MHGGVHVGGHVLASVGGLLHPELVWTDTGMVMYEHDSTLLGTMKSMTMLGLGIG